VTSPAAPRLSNAAASVAARVQVRVVLPRVADAAEDLDAPLGTPAVRAQCLHRGDRGREVTAPGIGTGAPRAVPCDGRRQLGCDQHVGQLVLDGLERADRTPELLTHLRVRHRHIGAGARPACGLRRGEGAPESSCRCGASGQHGPGRAVDRHRTEGASGVEWVPGCDGRRLRLDDGEIFTHTYEEEIRHRRAEDPPGVTADTVTRAGRLAAQGDSSRARAVGERREQRGVIGCVPGLEHHR
jgi:hypothetical protein